ncbi:phthiocerol/phenolphthiocerol synthesis type-I polyketide synthase D [Lipingzhangella halophila]|uniref:Phthiocerol/phenolphthiocerol synthesis type-I polyketide synthase D n=1 Tax=Lipingzhangella halophila TaxID=1783352 RepID=A0A7W7RKI0_9ACTN|nr:type I polyketide synthase [Lipingzhangella halophila]MBB4933693.1 phthiocerol/phenolphthiocerol synthesis type-I polyketide synthase D [Lipingzhangella halophila]
MRDILVERVAEKHGLDPREVRTDLPLADYGVTSTDAVSVAGELEEVTGHPLPPTLLWEHPTIDRLCDALAGGEPTGNAQRPAAAPREGERDAGHAAVAVVGAGCRFPGASGIADFGSLLQEGRDAVREVPEGRWDHYDDGSPDVTRILAGTTRRGGYLDEIHGFDTEFFRIARAEAGAMDPQQRILLEVAWEALEHAAIPPARLSGGRTGVFIGASSTEYGHLTMGDLTRIEGWSAPGAALSIIANRLSYLLDLRGPSMTIDTACSSSLVAVHTAVRALRAGECDTALTGGVNVLLSPAVTIAFDRGGGTSPDGTCRAFDAAANGMVRGEGCGVVVLKRLRDARRDGDRVLAVIRGSAVNSDGSSSGLVAPNPEAQRDVVRAACADAGVEPTAIGYVEAHGTGTPLGDPIEASALGAVLGRRRPAEAPLLIGSVKANLGHLEAAAGSAGLIKAVLSVSAGTIPATPHFTEPSPHIDFSGERLEVVARTRPWPGRGESPRIAGVSSFGFGGTNAHVIVEQAAEDPSSAPAHTQPTADAARTPEPGAVRVMPLTDISGDRVRSYATELAQWLESPAAGGVALGDVARTLSRRAGRGPVGSAVLATDTDELVTGLRALAEGRDSPDVVSGRTRPRSGGRPVWVFSGFGAGLPPSAGRLRNEEPEFARAVEHLDPLLRDETSTSLSAALDCDTSELPLHVAQPAIFGVQLALARMWTAYGVRPAAVVGHSMGEVAAAVVAGALTEREGVRVMAVRSALLQCLAGEVDDAGAMALAEISAAEAPELLSGYPDVHVAVYSAPDQTVFTGDAEQVADLVESCGRRGRFAKTLRTPGAGHSPGVDPVLAPLRKRLASLVGHDAAVPFYSTVHEDPRKTPECDAGYWAANLRSPVRFTQAIAAAAADGHTAFTEISAHPLVTHSIGTTVENGDALVTPTLRRDNGHREFHRSLARLRLAGHAPHETAPGRVVSLPPAPWRRTSCPPPEPAPRGVSGTHPLLGAPTGVPGENRLVAEADIGTAVLPWIAPDVPGGPEEHPPILQAGHVAETAVAAGAHSLGREPAELAVASLELDRLLPLDDHTAITTTARALRTDAARVEIHARDAAGVWQCHATAVVTAAPDPCAHETGAAGAIEVVVGQAPPVSREPRIPPALLAACVTAAGPVDTRDKRHIAVAAAGVRLWPRDPARGEDGSVRAWVTPGAGDLTIADAQGRLLARIDSVTYRAVHPDTVPTPLNPKLFATEWVEEPPPQAAEDARPGQAHWRVIAPCPGTLAEFLRAELEADGLGPESGELDSERGSATPATGDREPEQLAAVIDIPAGTSDPAVSEDIVRDATRLVQDALARSPQPQRVWFVTRGALPSEPGRADRHGSPAAACLRGLVRVLALEHPALNVTLVDIDEPDAAAAAALARVEFTAGATDDEVSWCDGTRRVARLARTPLAVPWKPGSAGPRRPFVRPGAGYIVTGGYGGLGLSVAELLARRGAGRVVLSGRSGPSADAAVEIERIRGTGCAVEVVLGDISADGTAQALVAAAQADGTPLSGVVHAAGLIEDRLVTDIDDTDLRRVFAPKARGAWRLHEATAGADLDWWVAFSSAAALVGSPGQGTYAAANAWLDAFTAWRRSQGLPATTINWGVWSGAGAAPGDVRALRPFTPAEGLEALEALLGAGRDSTGVIGFQPARSAAMFPELLRIPFFGGVLSGALPDTALAATGSDWPGPHALHGREPAQAWRLAAQRLRASVAGVLGCDPETIGDTVPLVDYGFDSLAAIRVKSIVEYDFGVAVPTRDLLTGQTLADAETLLAGLLDLEAPRAEEAQRDRSGGGTAPRPVGPRDAAERLAARVIEEALDTGPISVLDDLTALGATPDRFDRIHERLESETGARLDARELFATPTAERVADVVRTLDTDAVASSPGLRTLQTGDGRPPLFLAHPAGGTTGVYRTLAQLLGTGQPVHGLERFTDQVGVTERAARYVRMIREFRPEGPYRVGGWSFGGAVAYEMARQLAADDAEVDLLVLLDAGIPRPTGEDERRRISARRYADFADYLERTYGRPVPVDHAALARLDEDDQLTAVLEAMERSGVNELLGSAILEHQWTSHEDTRALEDYRPDGAPYAGRTVLYSATQPTPWAVHDPRYDSLDEARGWDRLCADLRIVRVDAHHLNLLDPPAVGRIARDLAPLLQRIGQEER